MVIKDDTSTTAKNSNHRGWRDTMIRYSMGFITAMMMMHQDTGSTSGFLGHGMTHVSLPYVHGDLGSAMPDPAEMARATAFGIKSFITLGSTIGKALH